MVKKIPWSWSRLETFEQCPRLFQLKYITKEIPFTPNEHTERGKRFHKYMEDAVNVRPMAKELNDPKGNLARVVGNIRSSQQYWAELQITFRDDWTETQWFAKDAWLRAQLDALAINGETAFYCDWKTGKVKDIATDQNALMAMAIMHKFPAVSTVKTAFIWLDHPAAPPTIELFDRKDMCWLEETFVDRAELINITNESGVWRETENRYCNWCDATPAQCSRKRR